MLNGDVEVFRAGFAYITRSGLTEVLPHAAMHDGFHKARKQWLVGIHHAISEPAAVEELVNLGRSEVRLAVGDDTIVNAIRGRSIFHAKTIMVHSGRKQRDVSLVAGSANLTRGALGRHARNYELCVFMPQLEVTQVVALNSWWKAAWSAALAATPSNLDSYARAREKFVRKNPDLFESKHSGSLRRVTVGCGV
jgi:hypothetical protein